MQRETLATDRLGRRIDVGRDVNLEAGIARGTRHGQAMRNERPVFVDEIKQDGFHARIVR